MGYTLIIGEAKVSECGRRVDCDIVRHDDAPAYDEPTDHENQRWPSYSGWAEAMRNLGMMDLMFNRRNGGAGSFEWNGETYEPLLEQHPGSVLIEQAHVEYAESLLAEYKAKHPTHRAEFPPPKPGAVPIFGDEYREEDYVKDPEYDSNLPRGEWLVYWLRWAIENCEKPVFVNS